MKSFSGKDGKFFYQEIKMSPDQEQGNPLVYIWAHGWGQSHASFQDMIPSLKTKGEHIALDFPGFGQSPEPSEAWDTKHYADLMAEFIERTYPNRTIIWIAHSFGARVGLQLASHYPKLINAMAFIGGAGLKTPKPWHKMLYIKLRIYTYKFLKHLTNFGLSENWLKSKFGSQDYKNASGIIRQIFIKVVNEDLIDEAKSTTCPVLLYYGEHDTETPPALGQKLNALIENSDLIIAPNQDHYSVIGEGRHQTLHQLNRFIQSLNFAKKKN